MFYSQQHDVNEPIDDSLRAIERLQKPRDLKRAEIAIARRLRGQETQAHSRPVEITLLLRQRARIRLLCARVDEALSDLEQVKTLSLDIYAQSDTQELVGDAHFARYELATFGFAERQDTAIALETYTRILKTSPHYANAGWVMYQRGRIMLTNNQIEQAVVCFERAMLLPSHHAALTAYCYERLAFVHFYEQRQPDDALDFIDKATSTYPANGGRVWLAQAHTLRSRILRELPDLPSAYAAAQYAVQIALAAGTEGKPVIADMLFNAGETAALLPGHERDVVQQLQHFLANTRRPLGIDVTWSRAHEMLGDAHMKLSQPQAALNAYQLALQFNPYHPWELSIYIRLARACYQLGNYLEAIDLVEKSLRLAASEGEVTHDYRVYRLLASAYYAVGDYVRALPVYEHALACAPVDADGLDTLRQYRHYAAQMVVGDTQPLHSDLL